MGEEIASGVAGHLLGPPPLPRVNGTTNDDMPAGAAASPTHMDRRTLFFAVMALYLFGLLLYALQAPVSKLVGCCVGRRDPRRIAPHNNASLPAREYAYLRRIQLCCRHISFVIRIFILDCTRHGEGALSGSGHELDESTYHSWTVAQTARWVHAKLSESPQLQGQQRRENNGVLLQTQMQGGTFRTSNSRDNVSYEGREEEYRQRRSTHTAVAALKKERIDGRSLASLTLDHLRSFGIAYGSAVHLMACLDALTPGRVPPDEEYAGNLPSWYASNAGAAKSDHGSPTGEQDNVAAEKAQQIMQDKFGITLPTLRNQDELAQRQGDEDARADARNQEPRSPAEATAEPASSLYNDNSASDEGGMPSPSPLQVRYTSVEAVLASMPANVRAVAERRPELVSQILQRKPQPPPPPPRQPPPRQTPAHLPTLSEEDGTYHPEEAINIDTESVSLLRRRTHNK